MHNDASRSADSRPVASFPRRSARWKLRTRTLTLPRRPLVMGIVNVTPDSFSDGGEFLEAPAAIAHGLRLAEQGADLLDVGGESTRPRAAPVDRDEELRRVMPVVAALCEKTSIPISIDTSKAAVAAEAVAAGAEIINDVTGLEGDTAMPETARRLGAAVCVVHMLGTPATMQENPTYDDVVEDIFCYLKCRRDALVAAGIEQERICLDPGIGFGKTLRHNLTLLSHCGRFHALGCPLLVGPSRKRFIGEVLGDARADRTAGTIGAAAALARQGVQILRVHDIAAVRQAMALFEAAGGMG